MCINFKECIYTHILYLMHKECKYYISNNGLTGSSSISISGSCTVDSPNVFFKIFKTMHRLTNKSCSLQPWIVHISIHTYTCTYNQRPYNYENLQYSNKTIVCNCSCAPKSTKSILLREVWSFLVWTDLWPQNGQPTIYQKKKRDNFLNDFFFFIRVTYPFLCMYKY